MGLFYSWQLSTELFGLSMVLAVCVYTDSVFGALK